MSHKRKHKTLTIQEKSEILERLYRKESMSGLANEYGVGRSTIYDIKKNREKIENFVSTTNFGPGKRQTLKKAGNPEVEEALYTWYLQERKKNTSITGHMLAKQAKIIYEEIMKKNNFAASKGWLERFKSRYGIRLMNNPEDKLSSDTSCSEQFKLKFFQKVKQLGLNPSQIYSAHESGIFWKFFPSETFVSSDEEFVPGRKMTKEHVTILPCANATGTHLLKMVVVEASDNLGELQNIDLPVHYYSQNNSWITKDLFKKWFDECFVPEVKQWLKDHNLPQKALLLLGNAQSHPSEEELITEDKCINVMFLPPNCTELQPMDQHIIQFLKQDYKKNLLLRVVSKDQPIEKTLKEFNIKDFIFGICQSWNELPPFTITSSWKNILPDLDTTSTKDLKISVTPEVIEHVAEETQICTEDLEIWWRSQDGEENISHEMSDKDIMNQDSNSSTIKQEDEDDVIATTAQVTAQDAIRAFELGLQWAEENCASCNELLLLRRLRDKALFLRYNNHFQTKES